MIQRIQTVYLLAAALACVACLCLPVGSFAGADATPVATLYNLWAHVLPADTPAVLPSGGASPVLAADAAGSHLFTPWALFALLVLVATGLLMDIFLYRARLVQSRLALLGAILLAGWYGLYAAFALLLARHFDAAFRPTPWAALPAVAIILAYLAFRAILRDEALVRSLDRLR